MRAEQRQATGRTRTRARMRAQVALAGAGVLTLVASGCGATTSTSAVTVPRGASSPPARVTTAPPAAGTGSFRPVPAGDDATREGLGAIGGAAPAATTAPPVWTPWAPVTERPDTAVVPANVVAAAPVCDAGTLGGAIDGTEGAAGHLYTKIVLTNQGGVPCRLAGYPEVRFVDTEDVPFGAPADQDEAWGPAEPVLLAPQEKATAALRVTQPGIQRGCLAAQDTRLASALRVTPPGSSGSVRVALTSGGITACVSSNVRQLLVGPLTL